MTSELLYLTFTALLTGVLWIPVVIGLVKTRGVLRPEDYKTPPTSPLPDWVHRANRAHLNAVENFGSFAAVVLTAHVLHVSTSITVIAAAVYFWARLAHAVVHLSGSGVLMVRTVLFSVAWTAFIAIAIEVLRQAA